MDTMIMASPIGYLESRAHGGTVTELRLLPDTPASFDPSHGSSEVLEELRMQLQQYFKGTRRTFDVPVAETGDTYRLACMQIPYGKTLTYGELARRARLNGAARAAGRSMATNSLLILVPCHRVVGANGSLTGYAGGLAAKTALLQLEGAIPMEGELPEAWAARVGALYVGVMGTAVACLPSCSGLRRTRATLVSLGSLEEGADLGFRPCRRCLRSSPQAGWTF